MRGNGTGGEGARSGTGWKASVTGDNSVTASRIHDTQGFFMYDRARVLVIRRRKKRLVEQAKEP